MVRDVAPGVGTAFEYAPNFVSVSPTLFFFRADDGSNGLELWRSDGTTTGTFMVMNVGPAAASGSPRSFTNVGGLLYFTANNVANGGELWRTDGTTTGTNLVKDIRPGT
ncbi:MAG: ELWxxDGT repeat protein, partial [Planctomycetia bacterium]